jgi:hypothetical protein
MDVSNNLRTKQSLGEEFNLLSKIDQLNVKAMNGGATPTSSFKFYDLDEQNGNAIHEEEYLKSSVYSRSLMFHYQLVTEDFHNKNKNVEKCI